MYSICLCWTWVLLLFDILYNEIIHIINETTACDMHQTYPQRLPDSWLGWTHSWPVGHSLQYWRWKGGMSKVTDHSKPFLLKTKLCDTTLCKEVIWIHFVWGGREQQSEINQCCLEWSGFLQPTFSLLPVFWTQRYYLLIFNSYKVPIKRNNIPSYIYK